MTPEEIRNLHIDGPGICKLMRQQRVTISALGARWKLPQARIRQVRKQGVKGFLASEWHYLITGAWLDIPNHT